jgi:YHS domain-containing protein
MADLNELGNRIKEKLRHTEERKELHHNHEQQRTVEFQKRSAQYTAAADRLIENVIRPRMKKAAEYFDNAAFPEAEQGRHHCLCALEPTQRFPATARFELAVCNDATYENLYVTYNLQIRPAMFQFQGQDKFVLPLNAVNEEQVMNWVDDMILRFVETYLQIETTDRYQGESLVTDPVCGMRIDKFSALAQAVHEGQTYYFCVEDCERKFLANPNHFVTRSGK